MDEICFLMTLFLLYLPFRAAGVPAAQRRKSLRTLHGTGWRSAGKEPGEAES